MIGLYRRVFPSNEREKPSSLGRWLESKSEIAPDRYHLIIIESSSRRNESLLGFAAFHWIASLRAVFLGYMVVEPRFRARGLGTRLFEVVKETARVDAGGSGKREPFGIFTELDRLEGHPVLAGRRLRFWSRLDMVPLQFDWEYPPMFPTNVPARMFLAFCPMGDSGNGISARELRRVCGAIYRSVYHRPRDDANLQRVLARLPRHGWVPRFVP